MQWTEKESNTRSLCSQFFSLSGNPGLMLTEQVPLFVLDSPSWNPNSDPFSFLFAEGHIVTSQDGGRYKPCASALASHTGEWKRALTCLRKQPVRVHHSGSYVLLYPKTWWRMKFQQPLALMRTCKESGEDAKVWEAGNGTWFYQ